MSPLQTTFSPPWPSPSPTPAPGTTPDSSPSDTIIHLHDDVFSTSRSPSPPLTASHTRPPDSAAATLSEANPDLSKLRRVHQSEGYRAGISESKTAFVQAGFDSGYDLGGRLGLAAGWVRGVAEGLVYAVGGDAGGSGSGSGVGAVGGSKGTEEGGGDGEGAEEGGGRDVKLIREVRALARDVEREVVPERIFCQEYFLESGAPRWRVGRWKANEEMETEEGKNGGQPEEKRYHGLDLDLDLVAQSHPVLRKWINRATLLADKLGLDINTNEPAAADTAPPPPPPPPPSAPSTIQTGEGDKATSIKPASPTRRS